MTELNMVPKLIDNHFSRLIVFPTKASALTHFHQNAQAPLPSDTDILYSQLSFVRTNPNSRTPTAIKFITASADPDYHRGFAAPVHLVAPNVFSRRDYYQWKDFQKAQERHRAEGDTYFD